jgi:hypothetical protein
VAAETLGGLGEFDVGDRRVRGDALALDVALADL